MRGRNWLAGLGLCLGILVGGSRGEEIQWRPAGSRPAAHAGAATLGRPIPMTSSPADADNIRDPQVMPTTYTDTPPQVRAQNPEFSGPTLAPPPPPPGFPASPEEKYNAGVAVLPPPGAPGAPGFWSRSRGSFGGFGSFTASERSLFQSDHCFDGFISPVSNPFLFEDPRALTELRPIVMFQGAPSSQWVFRGGTSGFFGLQGRLAVTERLSLTINKLGWVWTEPHSSLAGFSDEVGFAEFWISPKYTFLRSESTGTLGAVGLNFQIPSGPAKVFQDTGDLSLVPYVSMAHNFWRTSYGSCNTMGTFGYAFGSTQERSDYLFLSSHLDYDILDAHKYYPLLEMHFFDYTEAGNTRLLGFEGRDLFNFGSQATSGRKYVTIAPGFRYNFSQAIQTGVAVEFPIVGTRDLLEYRATFDMIFRY